MDSEENHKIKQAVSQGKPETDQGPYYHHAWWESYKGGVKGLLGGLLIGAGVGAIAGLGAGGLLVMLQLVESAAVIPAIVGAFAAGGALVGGHEFSQVGMIAGSDAASQEKSEERSKHELHKAVGELKAELAELKALVQGKPESQAKAIKSSAQAAIPKDEEPRRTTHCDEHCPPEGKTKLVFWKVAGIGAAIGAATGALLLAGGNAAHLFDFLGHATAEAVGGSYLAATATGAAAGASFGINRDVFRRVFDITDHWFCGILVPGKEDHQHGKAHEIAPPQKAAMPQFDNANFKPANFFRDQVVSSKLLAQIDPEKSVRH